MNLLVIPARWGSTRFPGKPLALIDGVPMVVRVWERVRNAGRFDEVAVATDDDRIAKVLEEWRVPYYMTGSGCRNGTERCGEIAAALKDDDLIVNVQGDEPLMDHVIPQRLLFNLQLKPERVWTVVRKNRGEEDNRRDVVKCWVQGAEVKEWTRHPARWAKHVHIGCYGYSVKRLKEYLKRKPTVEEEKEGLEQLRWREPLCCFSVEYNGIGVDRKEDIRRVEERLRENAKPLVSHAI